MHRFILLSLFVGSGLVAQQFEVVSIKRVPKAPADAPISHGSGGPGTSSPGIFRCSNCLAVSLIEQAFDLRRYQFPAANPLSDDEYQVDAKIPAGTTPAQFRAMLQNFLAERFHLKYHFKQETVSGMELTVAKGGPRLKLSAPVTGQGAAAQQPVMRSVNGRNHLHLERQTMADLALFLGRETTLSVVVDATGLNGLYDIDLFWVRNRQSPDLDPAEVVPGPSLTEAIESQLGLKLVRKLVQVSVFAIDHLDASPVAN